MANQNTITPHVWVSRVPNLYYPDVRSISIRRATVNRAASGDGAGASRSARRAGLRNWVKTSGSKGFHILLSSRRHREDRRGCPVAHAVGTTLVTRDPQHLTQEFSKADRGGRILVDTGRNGYSATFAAAYAVRAKPGAPVSAPCTWDEIERGAVGPRTFCVRTMGARIAAVGDLWADLAAGPHVPGDVIRSIV
jgi:bifunctional non-homologous end joining protein LigD